MFSGHADEVWDNIKYIINRPGVREVVLIGSVLLLKMAYRWAAQIGLEGLEGLEI